MPSLKDHLLSSYDFELKEDLIAQVAAEPRHSARMMIVEKSCNDYLNQHDSLVWDIKDQLSSGDLLILNNTRVLRARLSARLESGGLAELLLLEPFGDGVWLCLCRPARRMRPGDVLQLQSIDNKSEPLEVKIIKEEASIGGRVVQFPKKYSSRVEMERLLIRYGEVPLPPYIQKSHFNDHEDRYQTRFAQKPGAVAAPTAGLHLSDELINELTRKGIKFAKITLHVGIGTFRPLDIEDLRTLTLHREWVEVTQEALNAVQECKSKGGRVIAVGTTSVRALEAAFSLGQGRLKPFCGNVDLAIQPGFKFGVIDGLITNFHLPKSSLLLLVSALVGRRRLLELYKDAIDNKYRFYSYGDAMFITPDAILDSAKIS